MTKKALLFLGLAALVVLGAAIIAVKRFSAPAINPSPSSATTQADQAANQMPRQLSTEEIDGIIAKVASHIAVKTGERPTIATVQNLEPLLQQNPTFYKNAQIGDLLLIWSDQAVLYSPPRDLVLSVLPISLPPNVTTTSTTQVSTTSSEPVVEQDVTIEVRNGSGIAGRARAMATKLTNAGFEVGTPRDAKNRAPYETTIIVNVSDKPLPVTLSKLREITGAKVVDLPSGEDGTDADIIVIVGTDFTP